MSNFDQPVFSLTIEHNENGVKETDKEYLLTVEKNTSEKNGATWETIQLYRLSDLTLGKFKELKENDDIETAEISRKTFFDLLLGTDDDNEQNGFGVVDNRPLKEKVHPNLDIPQGAGY